jgi:tripartite motif-containing protein 71
VCVLSPHGGARHRHAPKRVPLKRKLLLVVLVACLLAVPAALGATFVRAWGGYGGHDGAFNRPTGVAEDPNLDVYVTDTNNSRVEKFNLHGGFIAKWGSHGTGPGQFNHPEGIAVDPRGFVYVADSGNNRIEKFDLHGNFIHAFGAKGSGDGRLDFPTGVAVDPHGNVLVADTFNRRIELFHANGHFIRVIGAGILGAVYGVTTDAVTKCTNCVHHFYVADTTHHRIVEFANDGTKVREWGRYGHGNGEFTAPVALAFSRSGHLFVVDAKNNRIQVFNAHGGFLRAFGSYGTGLGHFNDPSGLALSPRVFGLFLHLYVVDRLNYRIQEFDVS